MKNPFRYRWEIHFEAWGHNITDAVGGYRYWRKSTAEREARDLTSLHRMMYSSTSHEANYTVKEIK